MADVQVENGYTKLANELIEQLAKANLNGTQYSVVLTVIRYTYGFKRTEHEIGLGYIAKATGKDKMQIKRELDKLIERKIILVTKESTFSKPKTLKFNKNYDEWLQYAKKTTVSENTNTTVDENAYSTVCESAYSTVDELANSTVSENAYQEIKTKENIKNKFKDKTTEVILDELIKAYRKHSPLSCKKYGIGGIAKARDNFQAALQLDKVDADKILNAIESNPESPPWEITKKSQEVETEYRQPEFSTSMYDDPQFEEWSKNYNKGLSK